MDLKISRKIWMRGENQVMTQLLMPTEPRQQCCVGIYLTSLGVADSCLSGHAAAHLVSDAEGLPKEANWLVEPHREVGPRLKNLFNGSKDADALYNANDNLSISEKEREHEVASLFAEHGIHVTFED